MHAVKKIKNEQSKLETRFISAFKGLDLSKRRLPMMTIRGHEEGPIIWLCGAIHGDEVTGTEVIDTVFSLVKKYGLKKGILHSFPVMNPSGFEVVMRQNPMSSEDLNRQFPGDPNGNTGERLAYTIIETIKKTKPDLVIDLHTDSLQSIAYSLIDHIESPNKNPAVKASVEFVKIFGTVWIFEMPEFDPSTFNTTFTNALIRAGVPCFTAELGGPLIINKEFVEQGVSGILNILQHLEMIEIPKNAWQPKTPHIIPQNEALQFVAGPTTDASGIIEYKVKAGDTVRQGAIIARIKNVFGATEDIIRYKDGEPALILSLYDASVTFPGMYLVSIAQPLHED